MVWLKSARIYSKIKILRLTTRLEIWNVMEDVPCRDKFSKLSGPLPVQMGVRETIIYPNNTALADKWRLGTSRSVLLFAAKGHRLTRVMTECRNINTPLQTKLF